MNDEDRCCGSGTCIIDAQGMCWCGQQWDGEKMAPPARLGRTLPANPDALQGKALDPSTDIP